MEYVTWLGDAISLHSWLSRTFTSVKRPSAAASLALLTLSNLEDIISNHTHNFPHNLQYQAIGETWRL